MSFPYTIRPADPDSLADVLAMLPSGLELPTQVQDYAIADRATGETVAALQTTIQPQGDVGLRMGVSFGLKDPGQKDALVPFILLSAKALARRANASSVGLEMSVELDSDSARLLEAAHFMPQNPMTRYRFETDRILNRFLPVWERLQKRGKVPEGYDFIPLIEASGMPLAELLKSTGLGSGAIPDVTTVAGARAGHLSTVIRRADSVLVGVFVATPVKDNETQVHVPACSVLPEYQDGWAFIGLFVNAFERLKAQKIQTQCFEIRDHNPQGNTHFALRSGGEPGERLASYAFPMEEG